MYNFKIHINLNYSSFNDKLFNKRPMSITLHLYYWSLRPNNEVQIKRWKTKVGRFNLLQTHTHHVDRNC